MSSFFYRKSPVAWIYAVSPLVLLTFSVFLVSSLARGSRAMMARPELLMTSRPAEIAKTLRERGVKGKILIYFGTRLPAEMKGLNLTSNGETNLDRLRTHMDREQTASQDDSFINRAVLDGSIRKVIWVLPDPEDIDKLEAPFFTDLYRKGQSLEGVFFNMTPLVVCPIKDIPQTVEPVIACFDPASFDLAGLSGLSPIWHDKKIVADLIIISRPPEDPGQIETWKDRLNEL